MKHTNDWWVAPPPSPRAEPDMAKLAEIFRRASSNLMRERAESGLSHEFDMAIVDALQKMGEFDPGYAEWKAGVLSICERRGVEFEED